MRRQALGAILFITYRMVTRHILIFTLPTGGNLEIVYFRRVSQNGLERFLKYRRRFSFTILLRSLLKGDIHNPPWRND